MLLPAQVIPFLASDDPMLREQAIRYFSHAHDPSPLTAEQCWEAIHSVGLTHDAAGLILLLTELPQSDASTEALLAAFHGLADESMRDWLIEALEEIDFTQLRRQADIIFARTDLPRDTLEHLRARLELAEAPGAGPLWDQFDEYYRVNTERDWEETDYRVRFRLLEAIARFGQATTDRAIALVRRTEDEHYVHRIFAIDLLARVRHRPSLELLLRTFVEADEEDDGLQEALLDAIPRVGGVDAIPRIESLFPKLSWGKGTFAAEMLARIKHPDSEAALIRLINQPTLERLHDVIANALTELCTTDGLPRLQKIVLAGDYNPRIFDLKRDLVACTMIAGPAYEFPEFSTLREEVVARQLEAERRMAAGQFDLSNLDDDLIEDDFLGDPDLPETLSDRVPRHTAPIRRDPTQPGRNDPCPCGSGKKYKKCCLNKQP
jgi:hypothetical protein